MRKKVFFAAVFLVTMLFAVVGWAATYYLSPSGSATPPYDAWEKAANNLNQILSLDLTGENTIYVAEGTYSGSDNRIVLSETKHSNLSIIGTGKGERIIFDPGTSYSCYINSNATNVHFTNITVKNGANYVIYLNSATNITFTNCNIVGLIGHDIHLVYITGDSTVTLSHCKLWTDSYDTDYAFYVQNNSSVQIDYCTYCSPNGSTNVILYHNTTGNVTITNCVFAKAKHIPIMHSGSGNLTISNSIIMGGEWRGYLSNFPTVWKGDSSGSTSVCNSVVLPTTFYPSNFFSGGVTTENVIQADPRLKPFGTIGFIIPRVDDTANVDYATNLANVLKEYGYKGTFFVFTVVADLYLNQLRNLIEEGIMEVALHTYDHTTLNYAHALHFEYSGSDSNPTVELDSSRVIHLRTDGSDDVDIDTTQPDADTLSEIISNYSGTNNWTITKSTTDGQQADHISNYCKSETLAEMPATAAPCDIDFLKEADCTNGSCEGFYKVEIYDPKIDFTNLINSSGNVVDPQTGQTYEARTFAPPYGSGDEDVIEALRTSGYIGATGIVSFQNQTLPHNVFKTTVVPVSNLVVEDNEEQTTKNAELFAINVAINGLVVSVIAHNESDATLEEWRWILNGFKRAQEAGYNIQVTSLQLAIEALKRLGTYDPSTGDVDIHWPMPSFRPRHDSPCIDAGIKLPIHDENWRDLAGNRIRYGTAPDIGCYEYKTWPRGAWGMLPWIGGRYKIQWTPYGQ